MVSRTAYYINAQKAINPKGVVTIATSDSLGRPSDALVIDPAGDQHSLTQNVYEQAMLDKPTKTTYKSLKNLEGGSVATTIVSYDKGGRIISSDEPSLGKSSFTYDVLGNVMSMRRANQETRSEFDILGRLIKTSYVNGSSELFNKVAESKSNIDYVYDIAPYALGKLVSISHHMGRDEFIYDNQGRQKTVKKTIGSKTYSTTNSYNALSQISKVEYPDNHVYTAVYDEEGVAQKSTLNGRELAQSTIFDKSGNVYESQFVLGANTYVSRTPHDSMGRISQIGFAKKSGITETPYFFQQLNYDANAQLSPLTEITFKDGVKDQTDYTYTYDSFARLVKADSSKFNTSYSYDPFGRITAKNENELITYTYNDSFPFFAPKSISMPVESSPELPVPTIVQTLPTLVPTSIETQSTKTLPSTTPISKPRLSSTPAPTKRPTSIPLPTLRVTAGVTLIPIPTSAPMSCMFEPIVAIKEELADKTLRALTTEEAVNFLTINDKRKAKYDVDSTKKEFWNTFVDGFLKSCPPGGCDMKDKELCCVDEKNELPYAYKVGEKGFTGKIQPLIARATITLKDFTAGTKKYDVLRKYCTNMEGADGCPPDTEEVGGLREQGVPVTEIRNIQIGCNKRYEYGWIVKKVNPIEAFMRRFLPFDRGIADEPKAPAPAPKGTTNFRYNALGAMLEDNKQCYTYNRLNQLIAMKIKKTSGAACSSAEFIKTIYFYYDYAGTLVLQEEFKSDSSKPSKQVYYFGAYEDEYSEE